MRSSIYQTNYLIHHGILGMKWGVRRYQNYDGTLTPAGRKHYYSTSGALHELNDKGKDFNRKQLKRAESYSGTTSYNVRKGNPNFNKALDEYKQSKSENNKHYSEHLRKWANQEGEYKGKDYYQFKDMSYDDWISSKAGQREKAARSKLEKMVNDAAKEHPLYDKTFKQLKNIAVGDESLTKDIKYGEYVVKKIMSEIDVEARAAYRRK